MRKPRMRRADVTACTRGTSTKHAYRVDQAAGAAMANMPVEVIEPCGRRAT